MKKQRLFVQVEKKGTITVKCPDCHRNFGLEPGFVVIVAESPFIYTCPYCSSRHVLRND